MDDKITGRMQRAYSQFEVKSLNEEKRIITGIATTPSPDRLGDIVESEGAEYELPIPFLWQHDATQPIGQVTAAKVSKSGIKVDIQLAQVPEPGTLHDRLEEAWQSLKYKLVRGLSIGFAPIEYSEIKGTWSYRFIKWSWLELSAVTIPANAEASISAIKRFDARVLAATGHKAPRAVRLISLPGVSGDVTAHKGSVLLIKPEVGK